MIEYLSIPPHNTRSLQWNYRDTLGCSQIPGQSKVEPWFSALGHKRPCIGTTRPNLAIGREQLQRYLQTSLMGIISYLGILFPHILVSRSNFQDTQGCFQTLDHGKHEPWF